MKSLLIKDIEEVTNKKVRKNTLSIGVDTAEYSTGLSIIRTDNTKIYIEDLEKIVTNPKEDIMNRMEYFIIALDKFKQELKKYKEFKILVIEKCWMGLNPDVTINLAYFGALVWRELKKEVDYKFFIYPSSARKGIGFNKNDQISEGNIKPQVYTRDTKNKQGKLLHKKGSNKPIDIKLLVMDYLKMAFGVEVPNNDNDLADAFVLALCGILK
jgi:Holliday junction resolvasome RuvABC endonuclease subunit